MRLALALVLLATPAAASAAQEPPICADRPAKATGTCTVPAGRWQVETGLADWTLAKGGGARSETLVIGASLVKVGLSGRSDIELGLVPYVRIVTRDAAGRGRVSGAGDLTVRYKLRLTGDDARVAVAIEPFAKLPTASHRIGNGKVEGGLVVPAGVSLGGPLSLAMSPEIDWLADSDGHGRHAALANVVNLSATVSPKWTLGVELWGAVNRDPAGTVRQASADIAAAYLASSRVQLDLGANAGLNRATPDLQAYAGVAIRF